MLRACAESGQYKVLNHIKEAQSFVFFNWEDKHYFTSEIKEQDLDLPFRVCAFELDSGGVGGRFNGYDGTSEDYPSVYCLIAEELSPKNIIFYILTHSENNGLKIEWIHNDVKNRERWLHYKSLVRTYLEKLNGSSHGHQSPRTLVKWKENGEKKQTRITKVIYVRSKNSSGEVVHKGRAVQWSHAFWVMGHWRDISGIGKDRDGNYNVKGKTWVVPHVKNAELGDPVNKIRVAKNIDEQNAIN